MKSQTDTHTQTHIHFTNLKKDLIHWGTQSNLSHPLGQNGNTKEIFPDKQNMRLHSRLVNLRTELSDE